MIHGVVDQKKTVVYRAHGLQFQPWVLLFVQFRCGIEFGCNSRGVNFCRNAFCPHCSKFQHLDGGIWVNK